jgi:hypothetical protein
MSRWIMAHRTSPPNIAFIMLNIARIIFKTTTIGILAPTYFGL